MQAATLTRNPSSPAATAMQEQGMQIIQVRVLRGRKPGDLAQGVRSRSWQ